VGDIRVEHPDGTTGEERVEAVWQRNEGANSHWRAATDRGDEFLEDPERFLQGKGESNGA
jgi:hypothetical protein